MTPPPEPPAATLALLAAAIADDPAPRHTQPAWELVRSMAACDSLAATVTYTPLSCTGRLAVPGIRHLPPRPVSLTGIVHRHHTPWLVQLRHTDHRVVVPAGWVTSPDTGMAGAETPGPARRPPAGAAGLTADLQRQLAALLTSEVTRQLRHQGADVDTLHQLLRASECDTPRPGHRMSLPAAAVLTGIAAEDLALLVGHGILGADPNPAGGVDVELLDVLALARGAHPAAATPGSGLDLPAPAGAGRGPISAQLTAMCTPQAWLAGYGREYVRACLENLPGPHAWGSDPAVRRAAQAAAIDGLLTLEHAPSAARDILYHAIARHRDFLADEVRYQRHRGPRRAVDPGLDELGDAAITSHIEVAGHWLAAELCTSPGRGWVAARHLGEQPSRTALIQIREVINRLDIAVYDVA